MQKQAKHIPLVLICVAVFVVALFAVIPASQTIKWVGQTDLEVRFAVIDAESGQPIANAQIHVHAKADGFCAPPPQSRFTITTDGNARAKKIAKGCMCFGSDGPFENTFASHLPSWTFHVTANGYAASEPDSLNLPAKERQVQRGDPLATLSLKVPLHRKAA